MLWLIGSDGKIGLKVIGYMEWITIWIGLRSIIISVGPLTPEEDKNSLKKDKKKKEKKRLKKKSRKLEIKSDNNKVL